MFVLQVQLGSEKRQGKENALIFQFLITVITEEDGGEPGHVLLCLSDWEESHEAGPGLSGGNCCCCLAQLCHDSGDPWGWNAAPAQILAAGFNAGSGNGSTP